MPELRQDKPHSNIVEGTHRALVPCSMKDTTMKTKQTLRLSGRLSFSSVALYISLMTGVLTFFLSLTASSGQAQPPPGHPSAVSLNLEPNTNRFGNDYRDITMDIPDPALCRTECEKDPKCRAFTYVKPGVQGPKARCWLKDRVPVPTANSCCVSGVKTDQIAEPRREAAPVSGALSAEQRRLMSRFGYPDSFVIIFSKDDPSRPEKRMKYEIWRYYDKFTGFFFLDGRFAGTENLEKLPEGSIIPRYRPDSFHEGMKPEDLSALFRGISQSRVKVVPELLEEADVYSYEQILIGFQKNRLIYVESVPLIRGGVNE
jgi:hypothetical protein